MASNLPLRVSMLIPSPRKGAGLSALILAGLFWCGLAEAQALRCVDPQGNVSYRDAGGQTGGGGTPLNPQALRTPPRASREPAAARRGHAPRPRPLPPRARPAPRPERDERQAGGARDGGGRADGGERDGNQERALGPAELPEHVARCRGRERRDTDDRRGEEDHDLREAALHE